MSVSYATLRKVMLLSVVVVVACIMFYNLGGIQAALTEKPYHVIGWVFAIAGVTSFITFVVKGVNDGYLD